MEYIRIGRIIKPRGLKGELKVRSETDFPEIRFVPKATIFIFANQKYLPVSIQSSRFHGDDVLLLFDGLTDINLVEIYKGCDLYAEDLPLANRDENTYHASQIVGMAVYQNQIQIGRVYEVKSFPQGDYLVVEKTDHSRSLVPFRDEFILEVNLEKQQIDVIDMEGLL